MNFKRIIILLKTKWYVPLIIGLIITSISGFAFYEEGKYKNHDFISEENVIYINFESDTSIELYRNAKDFIFHKQSLFWLGHKNSSYYIVNYNFNKDMTTIEEENIIEINTTVGQLDLSGIVIGNNRIWSIQNKLQSNYTLLSYILEFDFEGKIINNHSLPAIDTGLLEQVGPERDLVRYDNGYLIFSETNSSFYIDRVGRYSPTSRTIDYIKTGEKLGRELYYSGGTYWTSLGEPYWSSSTETESFLRDWYGFDINFDIQKIEFTRLIENQISYTRNNKHGTAIKHTIFVKYGKIANGMMIMPVQSSIPSDNSGLTGLNIYTIQDSYYKYFTMSGIIFGIFIVVLALKKKISNQNKI